MANQFSAKIRFEAIAWRAIDPDTGAVCTVIDDVRSDVRWSVKRYGPGLPLHDEGGLTKTPQAARAACRRACARLAKSMGIKQKGKKK